jgi:SAM-dependent methyltransferase
MKIDQKELWQNKWKNITQHLPATYFARRSFSLMKSQRPRTLLDLGCGDGKDSLYFARKGIRVTAIDFSARAIEKLTHRATGMKVHPKVMDIRNLKLIRKFDVIYANLSLHYFDDKTTTRIFNDIHKLLPKRGLFFVRCKSINDPLYGRGKKLGKDFFILNNHKRHFFSQEYLKKKLAKFKILKIRRSTAKHQRVERVMPEKSSFIEAVASKS